MTSFDPTAVLLLAGGLLPLAAAPLLALWADRSDGMKAAVDAFIAVSITGIVFLHIWPEAFLVAGGWSLVAGFAGLMLPFLFHGSLHAHERRFYPALVGIAIFGLAVHAILDGVALFTPLLPEQEGRLLELPSAEHREIEDQGTEGHDIAGHDDDESDQGHESHQGHQGHQGHGGHLGHDNEPAQARAVSVEAIDPLAIPDHGHTHGGGSSLLLSAAVILHRWPMGLAIWWLALPILGRRAAVGLLALIGAGTVAGFAYGGSLLQNLSTSGLSIFEATIAGMLLHVVTGHDHRHHHHHRAEQPPWASAAGALLGLLVIGGLYLIHPVEGPDPAALSFTGAFSALSLRIAPWLLLGLALETTRRQLAARLPALTLGPLRDASPVSAIPVLWGLLGWQATLLFLLGLCGLIAWNRWVRRDPPAAETTRREPASFVADLDAEAHRGFVWAWLGVLVVALLEPLLPPQALSALSIGPSLALAAFLGALLGRNTLLAAVIAFYLAHIGWPPVAVMAFLAAGLVTLWLRWLSALTVQLATGAAVIAVAMVWAAHLGPSPDPTHLRAMDTPTAWQVLPLSLLVAGAGSSLFRLGFRAFLGPILEPVEDPCMAHGN